MLWLHVDDLTPDIASVRLEVEGTLNDLGVLFLPFEVHRNHVVDPRDRTMVDSDLSDDRVIPWVKDPLDWCLMLTEAFATEVSCVEDDLHQMSPQNFKMSSLSLLGASWKRSVSQEFTFPSEFMK